MAGPHGMAAAAASLATPPVSLSGAVCEGGSRCPEGWLSPPPREVAVAPAPAARRGIDAHCRRETLDSL